MQADDGDSAVDAHPGVASYAADAHSRVASFLLRTHSLTAHQPAAHGWAGAMAGQEPQLGRSHGWAQAAALRRTRAAQPTFPCVYPNAAEPYRVN
eukprot:359396-Chlamydomonas_euryale.AAC.3